MYGLYRKASCTRVRTPERRDRGFFAARRGPLGHTPTRIEPPKPFRAQVRSPRKCARLSWPFRPAERTRGLPIRGVEILPDMASAAGPSRTVRVDRDGARRRRCGPAGRCAASVQPAGRRASASLKKRRVALSKSLRKYSYSLHHSQRSTAIHCLPPTPNHAIVDV